MENFGARNRPQICGEFGVQKSGPISGRLRICVCQSAQSPTLRCGDSVVGHPHTTAAPGGLPCRPSAIRAGDGLPYCWWRSMRPERCPSTRCCDVYLRALPLHTLTKVSPSQRIKDVGWVHRPGRKVELLLKQFVARANYGVVRLVLLRR